MRKADSAEPAKYLAEIGKVELDGVTAKIAFDEKGDIKGGAVTIYQVRKGQWAAVQTMGGTPAAKP
jgi:branched-chain amino acid transport system substrate-binding protein